MARTIWRVKEEKRGEASERRLLDGRPTAVTMYLLALHVRFVSEVLSIDRYIWRMYEIDWDEIASFCFGGPTSSRSIFCHPGLCHDGCARMAGQRKVNEKSSFSGVFEGRSHGDCPGSLLSACALSLPALRLLLFASLAPSVQILGSEEGIQSFVKPESNLSSA